MPNCAFYSQLDIWSVSSLIAFCEFCKLFEGRDGSGVRFHMSLVTCHTCDCHWTTQVTGPVGHLTWEGGREEGRETGWRKKTFLNFTRTLCANSRESPENWRFHFLFIPYQHPEKGKSRLLKFSIWNILGKCVNLCRMNAWSKSLLCLY